jgi:succinoglycan biosynthesis transport protein ExoP
MEGALRVDVDRRDFASELRDTLRVLRGQWWLIALCAVVSAGAGYAWGHTRDAEYQSRARVLVMQSNPAAALGAGQPFVDPQRERATSIELLESPAVARRVIRDLKLKTSPGELLSHVSAGTSGDSNVIDVVVTGSEPRRTARIANSFAQQFVGYRRANDEQRYKDALATLRQRIATLRRSRANRDEVIQLRRQAQALALATRLQTGGAQVIERAAGPGGQVRSDERRTAIIAGLIGLLLGLALAFVRDRLNPRLTTVDGIRSVTGDLPVLASIPRPRRRARWVAGEGFHNLQVNVDALNGNGGVRSLLVTGGMPDEGKSTTVANLAAAMAGKRRDVTVFEADLRRPGLSKRFGVNGSPGVSSVLGGQAELSEIVRRTKVLPGYKRRGPEMYLGGEFGFVPAGHVAGDTRAVVDEQALADLVDGAQVGVDTVIVDGPPIGMFSDVMGIAQRVDGVILTVRVGHTRRAALERVLERLATASVEPMGIVVLGTRERGAGYGHYRG